MENNINNPYEPDNKQDSAPDYYQFSDQFTSTNVHKEDQYVTKKILAIGLTLSILLSALLGFGGGFLASSRSKSTKVNVSTSSSTTSTALTSSDGNMTVAGVADAAGNSVVEITTETVVTDDLMHQYISNSTGAGSGVIVSADGYIATNNHVISGANKITVTLKSGESYPATLIGTDSKEDVALIKIDVTGLSAAVFGDSSNLQVGQTAVAIGNPLGQLGGTVTDGIISALDRDITIDGETMTLLQTNAAINPGNSGGGLFNNQGQLIGLVVAKSSGSGVEGLGFAIPANTVKKIVEELSQYGYVRGRIDMPLSLVDVTSAQAAMMYRVSKIGVYVSKVEKNSSAESAGFKSGDLIKSVNSQDVKTSSDITSVLDKCSVGDTIPIVVVRNSQEATLNWTLTEQKPSSLQ